MKRPRVFISYSTRDSALAGQLRDHLARVGIRGFLAHHAIVESQEWRRRLRKEIASSDAVLLLITKSFSKSDWTDQETGIAIGLRKRIVGLEISGKAYGFVVDYQNFSASERELGAELWRVLRCLVFRNPGRREYFRRRLLSLFCTSRSFHDTRDYFRMLRLFFPLTSFEKRRIHSASHRNDQLAGGYAEVREFVSALHKSFNCSK